MQLSWNFASWAELDFTELSGAGRLSEASWTKLVLLRNELTTSWNFWNSYCTNLKFYWFSQSIRKYLNAIHWKVGGKCPYPSIQQPDFHYTLQNQFQKKILARLSNISRTKLALKTAWAEPSRAGRPPARAKSELSRAELNSVATLVIT